MDKVLIFDEDEKCRTRMEIGLKKYMGQFKLVVASSTDEARKLIRRQSITLCVFGAESENPQNRAFLEEVSVEHPQVPLILIKKEVSVGTVSCENRSNVFKVIEKPYEENLLASVILEGLDFIDEGLLWHRSPHCDTESFQRDSEALCADETCVGSLTARDEK